MQLEVAQLVRQHRLDLVLVQARDERVEEHDALGLAEAGEVGVAVGAAARAIHHEQPAGLEAAFGEQLLDAALERAFLHGRELVEQRRDERRIDRPCMSTLNADPHQPHVEPPVVAHPPISQSTASTSGKPRAHGDRGVLGQIGEPHAAGHLVEAEACLDVEGAIVAERQVDEREVTTNNAIKRRALQQRR